MNPCRFCGFQNAPGTKFCNNCGSYQWDAAEFEPPAPPERPAKKREPNGEAEAARPDPSDSPERPAVRIISGRARQPQPRPQPGPPPGPEPGPPPGAEQAARARPKPEAATAVKQEAPPPRREIPGRVPGRVAVAVLLPTPELEVEPPNVVTCEIRVKNTGALVDRFTLTVEGPAAQWATIDPPSLNLYPESEPAIALLSFQPPRAPNTPSGPAPFVVRATSREDPSVTETVAGVLEVDRYVDVTTSLVPQTSRAKKGAVHELSLRNRGNGFVDVALTAADPDNQLGFAVQPPVLSVNPGDYEIARVEVIPLKKNWIGAPQLRQFAVEGQIENGPAVRVDGRHEQIAIIPAWVVKFVPLVVLPLLALLGYLLFTAKIPPVIRLTQAEAETRLLDAGFDPSFSNVASEEIAAGRVVSTEPPREGRIRKGTDVAVFVSAGPDPLTVPELKGLDAGVARSQLLTLGLTSRSQAEDDDSVGPGQVFDSDPAAGELVPREAQVVLKVAPGGSNPANRGIVDFGPVDPATGFPSWYQDGTKSGLRLALCLDGAPLCSNSLEAFPGSPPDGTANYWSAAIEPFSSPLNQGNITFRSAVVAAFGATGEAPCPPRSCAERTFSLIEVLADAGALTPGATYRITHPFGTSTITANSSGGITAEIGREEVGCFSNPPEECAWEVVQTGRVGPFLTWADEAPPAGFVGDAVTPHKVTGSPTGNNLVKITGPGLGDGLSTDLFVVEGKVSVSSTPPPGQAGVNPDPPNLVVPVQRAGVASPPQTVTLQNHGDGNLKISDIQVVGTNNEDWKLSAQNCTGQTIPGGGSCEVKVTVTPSADGPTNGELTVVSNAFGNPHKVALSGTGQAAGVEAAPPELDLGTSPAGVTTAPKNVTIKNAGTADLVVARAEITGPNAGDFLLTSNACNAKVAPGKDCLIKVSFKPSTGGKRSAQLSITSDAPVAGTVNNIALTGTGQASSSKLAPTKLEITNDKPGTVTLSSTGTSDLKVESIKVEGPNASSFTPGGNCAAGGTVAPGGACTVDVKLTSNLLDLTCVKGTLVIKTDDPSAAEHRVDLVGRGPLALSCP
jgi:hypothetical protein